MSKKIKFAVVGCGHIGNRHAAMIRKNEECELVALCDTRPKEETSNKEIKIPYFKDIRTMLDEIEEIEVVCICTPNGLHAEQAILGLSYKKHVVIEKPMGLTKKECENIIFKALNVSRQVFCVMQNRYSPPIKWLKEIISKGNIGDVLSVEINCYWNRDDRYYYKEGKHHNWHGIKELDGGTLYTQFSHFIDILYWIFGDIKNIHTRLRDFLHNHSTDFEDSGIVSFDLVNGGIGSLVFSTAVWDKNMESSITVIGSQGSLKIGGQYMDKVIYCHVENYEMPQLEAVNPPNDYGQYKGSAANHHYVIQNVVDVLKDRKETTTNALEGMKVVDIIERIYAAV